MSGWNLPPGTTRADLDLDRNADERAGEPDRVERELSHSDPDLSRPVGEQASDPYSSEDYQRFLAETAKECRACPDCWEVPCPACCAGGICDAICDCETLGDPEDYDGFPEDYDDD